MDETYVGAKRRKTNRASQRNRMKGWDPNKPRTAVRALVDRGGRTRGRDER